MQKEIDFYENDKRRSSIRGKKKGRKKWIVILIIALLFVASAVTVFFILSKPEVRIAYSLSKAADDLAARPEVEPLLALLESGSIEASVKGENLSASGKVYLNSEEMCAYAEDFKVRMNGNTYCAEAYVGLDSIYASSDQLLGGSYGLEVGEAQEAWENFWGNEKKQEEYYILSGVFELYDEEKVKELFKDFEKISKANDKAKLELALEYGDLTEVKKEQKIGQEKMKVRVYRLVLDNDALENIDACYLEYLEADEDFREFLRKYERFFVSLAGEDADIESIDEIFEKYVEEQKDYIYKSKSYTEKFVFQLITKDFSAEALAFFVTETWQWEDGTSYEYKYSIESDEKGLRDAQKLNFCFSNTDVVYEIKENSDRNFIAKVTTKDRWGSFEGIFKLNKNTEHFSLLISEDGEEFISASGEINIGKDADTVRVTELKMYGEETSLTGEITFCRKDTMPQPPNGGQKNFKMSESENLEDNLYEFLEELFEKMEENGFDL